jgi:lipopolysaccharide-induced tumor necrosis factor-alpha factor
MQVPAAPPPVGSEVIFEGEPIYSPARQGQSGFRCPFCQSNLPPLAKRKISTTGWIVFVVLLIFCFPLSIIGLFIKEDYRVCSSCGIKFG